MIQERSCEECSTRQVHAGHPGKFPWLQPISFYRLAQLWRTFYDPRVILVECPLRPENPQPRGRRTEGSVKNRGRPKIVQDFTRASGEAIADLGKAPRGEFCSELTGHGELPQFASGAKNQTK